MLVVTQDMLDEGYWRFNGVSRTRHEFVVLKKMDDGTYIVRDPYVDTHWAITIDEVAVEERQGDTTPIPWTRKPHG